MSTFPTFILGIPGKERKGAQGLTVSSMSFPILLLRSGSKTINVGKEDKNRFAKEGKGSDSVSVVSKVEKRESQE